MQTEAIIKPATSAAAEYANDQEMHASEELINSLERVFDLSIIHQVALVNCDQSFLKALKLRHGHINVALMDGQGDVGNQAFDMFMYFNFDKQIENASLESVMAGLPRMADILFLSLPASSARDFKEVILKKLELCGYNFWPQAVAAFKEFHNNDIKGGQADDFIICKKKMFAPIASDYFFQGIHSDNSSHYQLFTDSSGGRYSYQRSFMQLIHEIRLNIAQGKPLSVLRASDGDYYFLRRIPTGSAKPGNRAITARYKDVDTDKHADLFWQNDIITTNGELPERSRWRVFLCVYALRLFMKKIGLPLQLGDVPGAGLLYKMRRGLDYYIFPLLTNEFMSQIAINLIKRFTDAEVHSKMNEMSKRSNMPAEAVYALVATKWLFRNYPDKIGLIAGHKKIELVERLMKHAPYREYVGVDKFTDYIAVPQKGAANNIELLAEDIRQRITDSEAKIFLVGVGSAKNGLIPLLKMHSDAIFIDVGCGIDALAGVVCQERPYFADWVNYRISDYDYTQVDFMDQNNDAWGKPEYKTIYI